MDSLDIDFLFTNIPLDETIDIWINKLFLNPEKLIDGNLKLIKNVENGNQSIIFYI